MTHPGLVPSLLAAALAAALPAAPAHAAPTKVWVAKGGADNASCGAVTAPCRTFQQAHDNIAAGGEIGVLTPGDYGPMNIFKSVGITNDGTGEAGFLMSGSSTGISIFGSPGMVVGLRGLVMDGGGLHQVGIGIGSANGGAVHIERCVVRNFADGITFGTSGHGRLFVSDTAVHGNGSDIVTAGIIVSANVPNAVADVVLNRVRLENNGNGLWIDLGSDAAGAAVHVLVRDSVVSGNAASGIVASGNGPTALAFVRSSSVVSNGAAGLFADGPGITIVASQVTVARNATGLSASNGGQVLSYANNEIDNNVGADGAPAGFFSPR